MVKKNVKVITTVCIFVFLTIITTATKLDTKLEDQTVTFNAETHNIESYNYKQGVYCQNVLADDKLTYFLGIPFPEPTLKSVYEVVTPTKNKRDCVFVNKFHVDENGLFGQFEDDDNWYILNCYFPVSGKTKLMIRVENEQELQILLKGTSEEVFKKAFGKATDRETKYKKLQTRLIKAETEKTELQKLQTELIELQTKLTKKEKVCKNLQDTSKNYWYAVIILGILVLGLIVVLISASTSPDSNTNRKFNVGDRVKVRNTKQQEWRTGVVKQSLKVEVDGWQKAHTWYYVRHIEPVSESTKSHGEKTLKSNDLISKNMTEKKTNYNDSDNSKKQFVTKNSSSNVEQNKSDDKNTSDSIDEVTEENTITPSEDNTEIEETASENTITNTTDTHTNSNSVQTTNNTNSS